MPKRKYYGYYRGRRQWRGSRAYAMRMIVTPIAIVLLLLIAWIISQPVLFLIVLIGAVSVFLIVKFYRRSRSKPSVPPPLTTSVERRVINYPKLSGNSTHREEYRNEYE